MKKIIKFGLLGLFAVMVASCSSNNTEEVKDFPKGCPMSEMGPCHKMKFDKKQCKENFEKWAKFESLSEAEQKELINKAKQSIDERDAKIKAFKDSIDALWKDFDNLTIEQQKSLLKHKMHGFHRPGFDKPGFHKDGPHKPHKMKDCKKDFKKCDKGPRPEGRHHKGPRPDGPRPEAPRK